MVKHSTEELLGHLRTTLDLEPGERVALCRCFQSKQFPFCDGTHKTLPDNRGPVVVTALESKEDQKS